MRNEPCQNSCNSSKIYKKGTIPYYFTRDKTDKKALILLLPSSPIGKKVQYLIIFLQNTNQIFFVHNPEPNSKMYFRVLHQNIASVLSKKEILEITIQELEENNSEPDVVCLSETFVRAEDKNYIKIHNYNTAACFCRNQKRGGTCILVKRDLFYKELKFLDTLAVQKSFECCGVEIPSNNLIILSIYRTPTSDPFFFIEKLEQVLNIIMKKYNCNKNIIIAGDFNINTLKQGKITENLQDFAQNFDLQIHVKEPTRNQSCIDHILSNLKNSTTTSF